MRFLSTILFLLTLSAISAQKLPEEMVPKRLVNDFTGLLTEQQQIEMSNKLLEFNNQTSTQIYVVTYDDLQDYPIEEFAVQLGEKWGIGQQGKDNGILILVSPAIRKVTIQTGYGMEGAVPDAIAKRLIETVITPAFKQGSYYAGLDSATNVLMSLTRGEFTAEKYLSKGKSPGLGIIFFLIILFFVVFSGISRTRKRFYSPTRSLPWWLLLGAGTSTRSGWGNFSSGSGSFGGGFGGFGGGGGGSFGGGGASGGW